jgi:hypothetical protein
MFHFVFSLPPSMEDTECNWHSYFTAPGLDMVLIDLCQYVYFGTFKYLNDNPERQSLRTAMVRLWPVNYYQTMLCPKFRLVDCVATKLIAGVVPSRVLYCPVPTARELLVDVIIKAPTEHFKVELRLKLRRSWLEEFIERNNNSRYLHTNRYGSARTDGAQFVSRLKHY